MIRFTVYGEPAPQGSKTPWGSEANPRTRPWRAAVSATAAEAMGGQPLISDPVKLTVRFIFPRPKSHYGTGKNAAKLKADAPAFVTRAPDLDKLLRAIGDALKGVAIRDDALIAELEARKVYGDPARVEVFVYEPSRYLERTAA